MIQNCTILKVMDNSGAKEVMCFKVLKSKYNNQSANIGDIIKVSIKSLKDKSNTSLKKGDVFKHLLFLIFMPLKRHKDALTPAIHFSEDPYF